LKNVTISGNTNRGINIVNVESGLLENITISGNSTSGDGAGLYYWGLMGTMTMTNVTISGNSAGGNGGGFMADSGIQSHLILNNVTISGNTAANGGGIYNNSDTIFKNTIVAGNTNNNCAGGNPITSNGYNLDSGNTCAFSNTGDLSNTDPLLGPLQDNGGPTWTHALLWGSPAIDTGDDAQCPPTDQRGVHRPLDGDGDGNPICDIGSYELEGPPVSPTLVTISGSSGGLVGQAYTFTASTEPVSTTLPITYTWQADDHLPIIHTGGLTDTVSFTWDIPGTQIITVTTSNLSGSVIDTHVITITDIPISGLTAFNDSPTLLGEATTFTAVITSGTNVSYTWDFGDSQFGSGETITHTYPLIGIYTATVTATNSINWMTDTTHVTITDVPVSGLVALNDSPTLLGEATTFTAVITSGTNISYTWDFGDSQFGSGETITHTYADHGLYTTTVTATNSVSWQAATTLVTIIPPNYPEYIPIIFNYFEREFQPISPTQVIITGPDEGLVGQGFSFTASVIPIFTTLPITYTWQTDEQTPVTHTGGVTDVISFTWDTAGLQLVTVSASNRYGSASASHVIMISDLPISGLSVSNDSPTQLGKTTTFTATTISGTNVIFDWDFGDGVKDSGQIVTHTYSATGWYTATITATNSATQLTDTTRVKIIDVPIHGLSASNDSPTDRGFATTFTATVTSGTNVIYTWNFGDNKTGSGRIITHTYTKAGNYTAKVSATNSNSSLSDTTEVTITVPHYQFYFPLVPKYSQSSPDANLAFSIPDSGVLMGLAYDGSMGMWKNK
jgi:PKD repeat protein